MSVEQMYYLLRDGHVVGNSLMWWRENGAGYTTDLDDAGKFTAREAKARERSGAKAIRVEEADSASGRTVDSWKFLGNVRALE